MTKKVKRRDVTQMVREELVRYKYDGLYTDGCGCFLDDLMPCGYAAPSCQAGYRVVDVDVVICGPNSNNELEER